MSAHRPIASCEHVTAFVFYMMIIFVLFILSIAQVALGQDTETTVSSEAKESAQESAVEKAVQSALATKIDFDFRETPLKKIADDLGKADGVNIELDTRELDDLGYDGKTKVSFQARGISVQSGLRHLLRNLDLTCRIQGQTVMITSHEVVEADLDTRFYDVSDLASTCGDVTPLDTDMLIDVITSTMDPTLWDSVGGPGAVTAFRGLLVISCTRETHEEIGRLLATLRQLSRAYARNPVNTAIEPMTLPSTAADEAVRAALDEKTISVSLKDITLDEALDTISKLSDVPIVIDRIALVDVGSYDRFGAPAKSTAPAGADPFGAPAKPTAPAAGADPFGAAAGAEPFGVPAEPARLREPVRREPRFSCELKNATLRSVLDSVVHPLDLAWMVRDEAIVITTPEECECDITTRLYPVRDLVVDDNGLWSPDACDALMEIITGEHPHTWDLVGGLGAVEPLEGVPSLVVSQTDEVHHKVARILAGLRHALSKQEANPLTKDRAVREEEDRMVLRVYYVGPWGNKVPSTRVDDLVAITRDLVAPQTWSKEARGTIHRFENAIVIRNRPEVHRKFTKLLARLRVRWHSTWDGYLRHNPGSFIPVVGENQNGQNPMGMGGMFAVQDR